MFALIKAYILYFRKALINKWNYAFSNKKKNNTYIYICFPMFYMTCIYVMSIMCHKYMSCLVIYVEDFVLSQKFNSKHYWKIL